MTPLAQINSIYFLFVAVWTAFWPSSNLSAAIVPLFVLCMGTGLYAVHRIGHTLLWRQWFEAHVNGHHLKQYPSKRFASDTYRHNQHDPYRLNTMAYVAMALLILWLFQKSFALSFSLVLYLATLTLMILNVEDQLHVWIHTRAPPIVAQSAWFQYLVAQHKLHHSGTMHHNYAVLSLWLDQLYGTLQTNNSRIEIE